MSTFNRRQLLQYGAKMGLGIRAAITGLPASFLLRGEVYAATNSAPRIAILASSSAGEPLNVCGPGTFDDAYTDYFIHPQPGLIDTSEFVPQTVNTIELGVESLSQPADILLGTQQVRMAGCFAALPADMLQHLVWFNYRSGANIHPQYKTVLTCYGEVRGSEGQGAEQLPAAIAQETAGLLGTTTSDPLVLGQGAFVSNGSSLANYSPTKLKTLANSVGQAMGGADNFAAMYDAFIDEAYKEVLKNGTGQQRRFFDQHAASRTEAADFGSTLGQLLEEITDDSIISQLHCAAMIAKLRLAPVVMVDLNFGGDNHQDSGLTNEANQTVSMIHTLNEYWKSIETHGVADDVFFANLDVFGRNPKSDGDGRGHYGEFVSGLMMGTHLTGGLVGGWELNGKIQATGINAATGTSEEPDIKANETLAAYYRTIMHAAGVPPERQEVRLPTGTVVTSVNA